MFSKVHFHKERVVFFRNSLYVRNSPQNSSCINLVQSSVRISDSINFISLIRREFIETTRVHGISFLNCKIALKSTLFFEPPSTLYFGGASKVSILLESTFKGSLYYIEGKKKTFLWNRIITGILFSLKLALEYCP